MPEETEVLSEEPLADCSALKLENLDSASSELSPPVVSESVADCTGGEVGVTLESAREEGSADSLEDGISAGTLSELICDSTGRADVSAGLSPSGDGVGSGGGAGEGTGVGSAGGCGAGVVVVLGAGGAGRGGGRSAEGVGLGAGAGVEVLEGLG